MAKEVKNEEVSTMDNDELKSAIQEQFRKIQQQNLALGFRVCCQTVLDKITAFESSPGNKSNNDYKRLIKDIKKFVETGLSRKMSEQGEIEVPTTEETVQN